MAECRPNFLVVGAAKAGTTSLHHYLQQVPGVFLPDTKEPHYFVASEVANRIRTVVSDAASYYRLFEPGREARWRGEVSVMYLFYHEQAIPKILDELGPQTKIGIMVRNPVARAYSAYLDVCRHNAGENLSFEQALAVESERMQDPNISPSMFYREMGLYTARVAAYVDAFDNVHIMLADELAADPAAVVRGFVDFLGDVTMPADLDFSARNVGGRLWKHRVVGAWIKAAATGRIRSAARSLMPESYDRLKELVFRTMMNRAAPMRPETKAELVEYYRSDVRELGQLIDRDLGHWLT